MRTRGERSCTGCDQGEESHSRQVPQLRFQLECFTLVLLGRMAIMCIIGWHIDEFETPEVCLPGLSVT